MTTSRFWMSVSRFSMFASWFSLFTSRFSYLMPARLAKLERLLFEFQVINSRHSNSWTTSVKVWTLYTCFIAVRIAFCKGFNYRLIAIVIASDETTWNGLWSITVYQARWIYAKTNKDQWSEQLATVTKVIGSIHICSSEIFSVVPPPISKKRSLALTLFHFNSTFCSMV